MYLLTWRSGLEALRTVVLKLFFNHSDLWNRVERKIYNNRYDRWKQLVLSGGVIFGNRWFRVFTIT